MIVDTAGLAQIVIDALAEAGFQIVGADRYPAMRMMRGAAGNCRPLRHLVAL